MLDGSSRNIQVFMDWMQDQDPMEEVPNDYVMMARVSLLLRGIASAFGMRMRIAPTWATMAEKVLEMHAPDKLKAIHHRRAQREAANTAAATFAHK